MTSFVESEDGTRIAYDRLGAGPPVVIVSGMFCTRATTQALADALAERCTVVNYDRRGRGESGDAPPYAVAREVEDLAALIAEVGGRAAVYGHSSGAGLALLAAAASLPITALVLHEPPYSGDDDASRRTAQDLAEAVRDALDADRPADAIRRFMADSGMPDEMIDGMANDVGMQAVAPTMTNDLAVMGDFDGGALPEQLVRSLAVPTLVMAGGHSPDFFRTVAERIVELAPNAELAILDGVGHDASADAVAPVVSAFVSRTNVV
jgi:pimeloyl-ACP methyl ester carboxylesterase